MEEENKYERVGYPFKILLEEVLEWYINAMLDNFSHILRWQLTGDASSSKSHSWGTTPFKVQVNFNISIFEGQIDEDSIDGWLNLLEGYFSIHDFFNRENIIFSLLKVTPHVKDWWET